MYLHPPIPQIMKLPSKLFYNDRLTCKAEFSELGPRDFPPIRFVVVTGQECQDGDSPSYYNRKEALKILDQVSEVCGCCLLVYRICMVCYAIQRCSKFLQRSSCHEYSCNTSRSFGHTS